ncbi:hypothetical protein PTKU46_83910 [Paraburkholderia terrae]
MRRLVREVAKQDGLKTALLPDDGNVVLGRHASRTFSPILIKRQLVRIKQYERSVWRRSLFRKSGDAMDGKFDASKGIPSTGS